VIAPGTYVVTGEHHAWKSFTLYADGRVEFVDARDGHLSYNFADEGWIVAIEKRLARGELRKEG